MSIATMAEIQIPEPSSSVRVSDNPNSPPHFAVEIRLANGHMVPWWAGPVESRLEQLVNLDANWNSHGARRVRPEAVYLAVRVIASLLMLEGGRPLPQIVPTWQGGLQLEWHLQPADIEITIDPRDAVWAYVTSADGADEDGALTEMEAKISAILDQAAN